MGDVHVAYYPSASVRMYGVEVTEGPTTFLNASSIRRLRREADEQRKKMRGWYLKSARLRVVVVEGTVTIRG